MASSPGPGGFLSGLMGVVGPRLEEKHQEDLKLKNQQKEGEFGTLWTSMQTAASRLAQLKQKGNLTPDEEKEAQRLAQQYAWSEQSLTKLTKGSKPLSEAFEKVGGFVKQYLSRPSPKGQMQGPQQPQMAQAAQPQPGLQGPDQGSGEGPAAKPFQPPPGAAPIKQSQAPPTTAPGLPNTPQDQSVPAPDADASKPTQQPSIPGIGDTGPSMQGAMALADPTAQKMAGEEREFNTWLDRGKKVLGPDANPRDLAEYAGSKGMKLPPQPRPIKDVGIERPGYEGAWNHTVEPDGTETWHKVAARPSGVSRVIGHLSVGNVRKQAEQGQEFKDEAGNVIDPAQLPDEMMLTAVRQGDKTFYVPVSQNQTHFTVGGKVYAVPSLDQINLKKGAGVELGVSRTPTQTTHSTVAIDPVTGKAVVNVLPGTSTPSTPGIVGRPQAGTAPAAPPTGTTGTAPATAPATPHASAASGNGASPRGTLSAPAGAQIRGLPPGTFNQANQRVTAVQEASSQIFGDPSQPDLKGLKDYGALADNPKSQAKIGKVLTVFLDDMEHRETASGSLMTLAKNESGLRMAVDGAKAKAIRTAVGELSPEEQDALDATVGALSTIIGLRSLTKAGAQKFSIKAIERELPLIGINTQSSREFYNKMARLAEVVYNGTQRVPPEMFPAGMVDRIKGSVSEMSKMRDKQNPSPKGKLTGPSASGAMVNMKSPDGVVKPVPASQVDHYKSLGAVEVK